MAPIIHRIIVIDHRPILREGIVAVLTSALPGFEIMGAEDFPAALDRIAMTPIALAITDFQVQGDNALSFLKHLECANSTTRCLILSSLHEIQVGYPCIRAGASGFVDKSSPVTTLVAAIQSILAGRHYCSERLAKALMENHGTEKQPSAGTHLTPRELQIFSLIGEGMAVSTIAAKLGLSVKTVEAHREHIKNKLGHQCASQVTAAAVRWLDDSSVSI